METIFCRNPLEIKREKQFLEKTLHLKIKIKGRFIEISGDPLDEFDMSSIIDAVNLGFSVRTASLITREDFVYEKINIKDHTRRKDLSIIRGRIIGTHGKTKNTVEQISGCEISLHDNTVGIIGPSEEIEYAVTAIINIIKGTKQTNAYKYLERIKTEKKKNKK